jgi:murein DD-endopeptidase MepM/ murein hydrolase activator NlpD
VKFIYEASPTEIYELEREGQGYVAQKKPVSLDTRLVRVAGEIRSSLFEAMDEAGEQDALTIAFADILAWEIDFYKDVREGDQFRIVVEKIYKEEQFIQYGKIQAVEFQRGERVIRGIRYKDSYYDENGLSLKKAFLKAPLKFSRISSRFSRGRIHPIWAVADGAVASCGWNSGFGNQVILRHTNGYTTCYGHLSTFGRGIRKGMRVKQQQVIGYVGSTGLSTGPHLDYRLTKNGQFRNPLKESFIPGVPIEKKEMEGFRERSAEMMAWLQGDRPDSKTEERGKKN